MERSILPVLRACKQEDWYEVERESVALASDGVDRAGAAGDSGDGTSDSGGATPATTLPRGIHSVYFSQAGFHSVLQQSRSKVPSAALSAVPRNVLSAVPDSLRGAGTVVISHGFTESALKYAEMAWYFLQAGFGVLIVEHRGHGLSLRESDDPDVVSIDDWRHYVTDFVGAVHQARERFDFAGSPLHLFAHSLGGAIGAAVLEEEPGLFDKAVLSSPMMTPKTGMPAALAYGLSSIASRLGWGAAKVPTLPVFAEEYGGNKSGGRSVPRTQWYHSKRVEKAEYRTTAPSFNWVQAALRLDHSVLQPSQIAKISAKILIFQAGDDHWVSASAETRFVARARRAGVDVRPVRFPSAAHEIFSETNDVLGRYLDMVLGFLAAT
jgi:lysophospholipase